MHSFRGKLPVRSARGPCSVGVGTLLMSVSSTESSVCAELHKDEADRGCRISLCFKITSCYDFFCLNY